MRSRSEYLFVCLLFACLVLFFFYGSICSKEGRTSCSRKKKKRTHRRLILAHLTLIYLAGRLIDLQVLYTLISTLIGMQY